MENELNKTIKKASEKTGKKTKDGTSPLFLTAVNNPLWLSISESAKIGGVQTKTIRRAIQAKTIKYKVAGNRYMVEFSSLLVYLHAKTKLKNKLNQFGVGQYVEKWKE